MPFEVFVPVPNVQSFLKLFGLLKLFRVKRLSNAVSRSNLPKGTKVQLKILMMAFNLFIVMHVLACIWFALVILA